MHQSALIFKSAGPGATGLRHVDALQTARAPCNEDAMSRARNSLAVAAALAGAFACGPSVTPVEVKFAARVGDQPFACNKKFDNLGLKKTSAEFTDFKLFVRGLVLIDTAGKRIPLTLEQDELYQRDDVALLDFEDGTGACETGSMDTRTVVKGTVPPGSQLAALEFDVGFPEEKNHLDATTAKAPLNVAGMWWSWTGGFKFFRVDAKVPGTFYFHLGASGCDGSPELGFSCKTANLPHVRIEPFNAATTTIELDVAKLYEQTDLTAKPDQVTDFVPGCMSESADPDCAPLFGQLGLPMKAGDTPGPQVVFTGREGPAK
jgi:uncharacterized repeat protein (TIGR04052 family)